jgi:exodeoxyribonuclease VIII
MKPSVFDVTPEQPSLLCPKPGIYEQISFEDYVAWEAINHTRLCRIDKSPLNYLVAPEREKSQAFALGSLVHTGRLEPELLRERYVMMPDFANSPDNFKMDGKKQVRSTSSSTTWYKEQVAAFHETAKQQGREVITEDQWKQFDGAMAAFKTRPELIRAINAGRRELSIVWNDRRTGLLCKARIDCACSTRLIDLKTTDDGQNKGPLGDAFEWSIANYSYHTQAAFYADGWEALTGEKLPFWFAVVTTQKPHQALFSRLGDVSMEIGRNKNIGRLSRVLACKEYDSWPGYENPELLEIPEQYIPEESLEGFDE